MLENFKRLTVYRISDSEQRLNSNSQVAAIYLSKCIPTPVLSVSGSRVFISAFNILLKAPRATAANI